MSTNPSILLAEDDHEQRTLLSMALEGRGFEVTTVSTGHGLRAALQESTFEVVVTDFQMPGTPVGEVVRWAESARPSVRFIIVTAMGGVATLEALRPKVHAVLSKPLNVGRLVGMIDSLAAGG